jgi:hypothetical protein
MQYIWTMLPMEVNICVKYVSENEGKNVSVNFSCAAASICVGLYEGQ